MSVADPGGDGMGIAGGICGIVAVVLCWIPFVDYISLVLGALAIIFALVGIRQANRPGGGRQGMAITGMVTGVGRARHLGALPRRRRTRR